MTDVTHDAEHAAARGADDPLLETIVREAVQLARPELVILFGSRARGDFRDDSDYDVFVVADEIGPPRQLATQLREALRLHAIDSDVIAVSTADYARQQHDAGFLACLVSREGRVLFASGRVAQRSPAPPRVRERRKGDVTEGVRMWLERAANDFRAVELLNEASDPVWDAICFHAHAGAEKLLKALIAHGGTFPPRTHDLVELLRLEPDVLRANSQLASACATLNPFFDDSRYPPDPIPTPERAHAAVAAARTVHRAVHDFLTEA